MTWYSVIYIERGTPQLFWCPSKERAAERAKYAIKNGFRVTVWEYCNGRARIASI